MFRTIALILSGNLSNTIIMMVRNLVVARFLSLEDYGIASTFILAVSIVEMMSALGIQQQIIQSKNGNDSSLQAALQGFQVIRGITNAMVLFLLGGPLADFFGVPEAAWAYRLVALVPLLGSFVHMDISRLSRQMKYWPGVITTVIPGLGSLLLVWPFYLMFGDYRVILFAILSQFLITVVTTHVIAERPYRLSFDRAIMKSSLRFGWPLMLNGALMFGVFNGERMIVGRELGLEPLALFSMALSLTMAPTLMIGKTLSSFFLPQLSGAQGQPGFPELAMAVFQGHMLMGNLLVLCVALLGGPFVHMVLGVKYSAAIPLLTWLAVMQVFRVYKGGSSTIAMAAAHTGNAMIGNMARVALLPLAWIVVVQGGDLLTLVWIGIGGEMAGFVIGLWLALWRQGLPLRPLVAPLMIGAILLAVATLHAHLQVGWMPNLGTSVGLLLLFAISLLSMPDLRAYVAQRSMSGHAD